MKGKPAGSFWVRDSLCTATHSPLIIFPFRSAALRFALSTKSSLTLISGAIFVLSVGTGVGYATAIPSDLTPTWGRVSNIMGGVYFIAWSLSFYPQVRTTAAWQGECWP